MTAGSPSILARRAGGQTVMPLGDGSAFLRLSVALAGLAVTGCTHLRPVGSAPTDADFATIRPGMTDQQVLSRFGPPTWTFGVRQENLTIWNYRFNPSGCIIYQVSVRPDGTVRDAGSTWDPACDGPSRSD